jgi:hypothetical protein
VSESDKPLMLLVAELCEAAGTPTVAGILFEHAFAPWAISVNGKRKKTKDSRGAHVEPFACLVWLGDWPAGVFNLRGGSFIAMDGASEDDFVAALVAETNRLRALRDAPEPMPAPVADEVTRLRALLTRADAAHVAAEAENVRLRAVADAARRVIAGRGEAHRDLRDALRALDSKETT